MRKERGNLDAATKWKYYPHFLYLSLTWIFQNKKKLSETKFARKYSECIRWVNSLEQLAFFSDKRYWKGYFLLQCISRMKTIKCSSFIALYAYFFVLKLKWNNNIVCFTFTVMCQCKVNLWSCTETWNFTQTRVIKNLDIFWLVCFFLQKGMTVIVQHTATPAVKKVEHFNYCGRVGAT